MHELSLVESILRIIEEYAEKEKFARVVALRLSFGKLSCVDPKSLRFAFEIQSRGGRAEGAVFDLEILPARVGCLACGKESEVERFDSECPACRAKDVLLVAGTEELKLIDMDVE